MTIKALIVAAILAGYLVYPASANSLGPTACRFSPDAVNATENLRAKAPAMEYLAAMARARDRDDTGAEVEAARRAAREIATYPSRTVEVFLDVADSLSPRVISREAHLALARGLSDHLHPIDGQAFETDTGVLRAYLKAHHQFQLLGTGRFEQPAAIRERIKTARICRERRFFLLLEYARHTGENYYQPLARRRLGSLRHDVDGLAGIGREGLPMKWYALMRLTAAAVHVEAFGQAEKWLADTIREVERLDKSGTASAAVLEEVKQSMVNFPEYVASEHAAHRRLTAAIAK
jgi:hypothetical protein